MNIYIHETPPTLSFERGAQLYKPPAIIHVLVKLYREDIQIAREKHKYKVKEFYYNDK